jgi:hypothetical protein
MTIALHNATLDTRCCHSLLMVVAAFNLVQIKHRQTCCSLKRLLVMAGAVQWD